MALGMVDRAPRWTRDDLEVAEGREAFAALLLDYFDRTDAEDGWWVGREQPWKRLARQCMGKSAQLLIRIVSEGAEPKRETLGLLVDVTGIPMEEWLRSLGYEAAGLTPPSDYQRVVRWLSRLSAEELQRLIDVEKTRNTGR